MIYDKNPEFILDNSKIKAISLDVNYHVDIEDAMRSTLGYLGKFTNSIDKEYNLISDSILQQYANSIEDQKLKNQINCYISNMSEEYLKELRKFNVKRRIDKILYPLKKGKGVLKKMMQKSKLI